MKLKILINYIFFILLILFTSNFLAKKMLINEDICAKLITEDFYKERRNSADIVFIGASSTYTSWLPLYAWGKYGITSLIYTSSGLPTGSLEFVINEIKKTQNPKVIVINIDSISQSCVYNQLECINIHRIINKMKPSLNKIMMMKEIKKSFNLNNKDMIEFYFPIIRFHSNWKHPELIFRDKKEYSNIKTCLFFLTEFYFKNYNNSVYYNTEEMEDLDENSIYNKPSFDEYYKNYVLNHMFQYLSTQDNILLVNTRMHYTETKDTNFRANYKYLFTQAEKYNIPYIDISDIETNKKINLKKEDYLNFGHYNFFGAMKYTNYLAKILKEKYNIEDKRKNVKYREWNKAYQAWYKYIYGIYLKGNL